jgi:soluble lytic murein transglycosylase-like protein
MQRAVDAAKRPMFKRLNHPGQPHRLAMGALLLAPLIALTPGSVQARSPAVRCVDQGGSSYLMRKAPDPAYTFFTRCEPVPADEVDDQARAGGASIRERLVLQQRHSPIVIWAARSGPWAPARGSGVTRLPAGAGALADRARSMEPVIDEVARRHGIDPNYLKAMMRVESGFQVSAVSPKGATGLMQVMPATARRFGVDDPSRELHDPYTNVETAARYIKFLQREFHDDWYLITAAYNAGEGAVRKHGNAIPPYKETRHYVRAVEQHFDAYSQSSAAR